MFGAVQLGRRHPISTTEDDRGRCQRWGRSPVPRRQVKVGRMTFMDDNPYTPPVSASVAKARQSERPPRTRYTKLAESSVVANVFLVLCCLPLPMFASLSSFPSVRFMWIGSLAIVLPTSLGLNLVSMAAGILHWRKRKSSESEENHGLGCVLFLNVFCMLLAIWLAMLFTFG